MTTNSNYVPYLLAGCLPLVQSVRHGSKAVTRHRKPMHFLKQKLMAVTEYIPPKPAAPPGALARRIQMTEEVSRTFISMETIIVISVHDKVLVVIVIFLN